ncbi:hypothetical protein K469DRAFT_721186, partial [Zopfia rhizophila CBS 207.26]
MTLRGQTEAHLYDTKDYNAHVRSHLLYDRATAVSPIHVEPFHLRRSLQRRGSASNTKPTRRSAGFDFHGCLTLSSLIPLLSHRISLQRAETSSRLLLSLGIGYGGLERYKDGVGLIKSFVRSAEGTMAA